MSLIKFNRRKNLVPTFNSWMDNFFKEDDGFMTDWNAVKSFPPVNVEEGEEDYRVSLAAPGLKKDDFNIEVIDNSLVISSETSDSSEEKEENFTRKEFSFSSFRRSFWLPENVNADNIKASYEDGLLKISVPKTKVEKAEVSKKIEVV